jgi:DNA gyrase/topoisomerase IV subunit B
MNNIVIKTDKAPASSVRGTTVEYIPDYKLFGITDLQSEKDPHLDVLYTRLMNLSIAYPGMKISFNGKMVKANNFKDYVKHFSDKAVILNESDRIMVAVYPTDGYEFTHIANGLLASEGGNLNDYIVNGIVTKFTERLQKSYKKLTTTSIKSKIGIISIVRDVKGLKYSSQTKEKITNNYTSTDLPLLPFAEYAEILNKSKNIREEIIELYRIQQEMEKRKAIAGVKKATKERVQGHIKATQTLENLNVSEGLSPQGLLMEVLPRSNNGFYGLTGLFTNVEKATNDKIAKNKVIQDLVNILDIDMVKHSIDNITYKNVIISSDSDGPGIFIAGLLITFFNKFAPDFIKQGRLKRNVLPLMIAFDKKGKIVEAFKYFRDFVAWKEKNDESKYEIKYYKGLASFDSSLVKDLFSKYGQDYFIETYTYNEENPHDMLKNWFSESTIEWRKTQLLNAPELDIGIA